jgi:hypothetical protein
MTKPELFVEEARSYIGTHEEGGDNHGPLVELFQKAVDGKASGEAWCIGFIQYCAKTVDTKFERLFEKGTPNNQLPQTEHALTLWNRAPLAAKLAKPEPGCLVIWQYYKNGTQTINGHGEIVVAVRPADQSLMVIGGNTGPGKGIVREGDGVYLKQRPIAGTPDMRLKGYLKVWP